MKTIDFDELVALMTQAMYSMTGDDLADLYNAEFGDDMEYLGDNQFIQRNLD